MAGQSEVLKEYLLALGFKLDSSSSQKFDTTLFRFDKRVLSLAKGTLAIGAAAQTMVVQFSRAMEQLYYSSRRAESAAGNLKAYEYGARQIGLSGDAMRSSIEGMARALRLNPGLTGLLKDLGVRVEGRDRADVLTDMVAALRKMPFYQAAQYAQLFGMDPDTLLLLQQGLDKLREAADLRQKMAKDAGLDMDQATKAGLEYANTLDTVKERLSVLGSVMSVKLLPMFKESAGWLDQTLANLTQVIGKINSMQDLRYRFGLGLERTAQDVKGSGFWKWLTTPFSSGAPVGSGGAPKVESKASPSAPSRVAGGSQDPATLFAGLEAKYGLPGGILDRMWAKESSRGTRMLSPKGAQGHFQFMPKTAAMMGLKDPNDLASSANAAAAYLSQLTKQFGSTELGLAAYNWGEGNLSRKGAGAAPWETRDYVQSIAGKPLTVQQHTTIHVVAPDPVAAGNQVAVQQARVNADLVRNLGSSKVN